MAQADLTQLKHTIASQLHLYYEPQPDGTHRPKPGMEPLFVMRSCQMGAYAGRPRGGLEIGEDWRQNDGLVNYPDLSWRFEVGACNCPVV